jgi:hypothetical protein
MFSNFESNFNNSNNNSEILFEIENNNILHSTLESTDRKSVV